MVGLGDEVRDKVSGFQGIAIAIHSYLNGCNRVSVQPRVGEDMKLPEMASFDEPQLQVLSPRAAEKGSTRTGGPEKYMPSSRAEGGR